MLSNEVWKPIKGFENLYEISNLGRVKALSRYRNCNKGYGTIKEHIMKQTNCRSEYYRVPLTNEKHIKKYYSVHRLVAEAFLENFDKNLTVNHKDGNKLNNKVNNLEMMTLQDNIKHAYKMGLNPSRKKIVEYIDKLEDRIENLEKILKI